MKNFLMLAAVLMIALVIPINAGIAADAVQPQLYTMVNCGPDCDCWQDCLQNDQCTSPEQCQWYRLGGETWSAVTPVRLRLVSASDARPTTYTGGATANTPGWQYTSMHVVSYPAILTPLPTYRPVYHCARPLVVGVPTTSGYFYAERRLGLLGLRGKVVQYHKYGP